MKTFVKIAMTLVVLSFSAQAMAAACNHMAGGSLNQSTTPQHKAASTGKPANAKVKKGTGG
jgi:hypothetical protein